MMGSTGQGESRTHIRERINLLALLQCDEYIELNCIRLRDTAYRHVQFLYSCPEILRSGTGRR
jgi:hypothetical protein